MIRDKRARGLLLAGIVVLSVIAGAIAVGPVVAQDGTDAANDTNATNDTSAGPTFEYVQGTGGLQARFADAQANTVESIPPRTINFDIINTQYEEPYTVTVTATGMNETILEEVVYANDTGLSRFDLTRDDIIGFDFTGVEPGNYEVTASPVDADASVTVPIEIVSEDAAATDNETEEDGAEDGGTASAIGNFTIDATPASPNTTANHTLALTAESDVGNLTGVAVNYSGSNVSLSGVGPGTIVTANVSANGTNTSIIPNVTTGTVAPSGETVTFGAGGGPTIEAGDELVMTYSGAVNPPEAGTYDVSVTLNPGTNQSAGPATAALEIGGMGNDTGNETPGQNETPAGNETPMDGMGNATISAAPASANATANHTLVMTPGTGVTNLTSIAVNYSGSNVSLSGVGPGTVVTANVSSNGTNTSIIPNVTTGTVAPSGETVTFGADGSLTLNATDQLVMTYSGAVNPPEADTYDVTITLNGSGSPASDTATLDVSANDSMGDNGTDTGNQTPMGDNGTDGTNATETTGEMTTEEGMAGEETTEGGITGEETTEEAMTEEETTEEDAAPPEEPADTPTDAEATTENGTQAGGPGFGIAVALVAVLAAALIVARRR